MGTKNNISIPSKNKKAAENSGLNYLVAGTIELRKLNKIRAKKTNPP